MSHAKSSEPTRPSAAAPTSPRPAPSKARQCPCCGRHSLRLTREPGRACRYRHMYLTLPPELPVPTCLRCRHMVLTYESVPQLDSTLKATFRAELVHRASVEISHLSAFYSQRRLERELDLSQGYLSKLCSGDSVPSAVLVSLLALLSSDPSRVEELKGYWALPVTRMPPPRERRRAP